MHNWTLQDTIAALATPPGEGAIGVIRISGKDALPIAASIFSGPVSTYKTHTAHYGQILAKDGSILDSVLLLIMRAPRSYTGEDTIEISCHGGSLITRRVLDRIFEAGARPAQPGEFSLRAFLNNKIDLAQAEAVQQVIAAKSEKALHAAGKQLAGALSTRISSHQKTLTRIAAILEAWVDFPEEGLEFAPFEEVIHDLQSEQQKLTQLAESFHEGRRIHEGLTLCLLGTPNVGKSSLLNALLGTDRAIVTEIAGTTRDLIEEDLTLGGMHFRLIDTAGIRKTDERVEQEGIRRSKEAMHEADLLLLLLDASRPLCPEDRALLAEAPPQKTLLVWNKVDLGLPQEPINWQHQVHISAKEKLGLLELQQALEELLWETTPQSKEETPITKMRHHQALICAIELLERVIIGLEQHISPEFVSSDLKAALHELGTILGMDVTEEILTSIFSQFCLGK